MLRIAVCDDDQLYLTKACTLLEQYARERDPALLVDRFSLPSELLDSIDSCVFHDVYLLDIYMPGISGMSVAAELRKRDIESPIIFLTTSKEHALEAFGVGATQYLVKPYDEQAFFVSMDKALREVHTTPPQQLMLKTEGEYRNISVRDIIYCETQAHYQKICLKSGEFVSVRATSVELFDQLAPFGFFHQCSKAYIVALTKISRLTPTSVVMQDGTELSIPKSARSGLKAAYFAYFEKKR